MQTSADRARAHEVVALAASQLGIPLYTWTRTKGLKRRGEPAAIYQPTTDLSAAFAYIEQTRSPAIWVFEGLGKDLEDATRVQALRDVTESLRGMDALIVLIDGPGILPDSLRDEVAVVRLPAPAHADYVAAIHRVLGQLQGRARVKSSLSAAEMEQLVAALKGFTISEAERMITKAIMEDGSLSANDVAGVVAAKHESLKAKGLLELCSIDVRLDDVAGIGALKDWLATRRAVVSDPMGAAQLGLPFPKGMLLMGAPGCGKSMCAKAVAADWGLPLLRMDTSGLFDKYVGESEKRFLGALDVAQRASPAVLWIDEIEKAFSSGNDSDGGVSTRVLGSFLSWLQDRRGDVFVVATANDIAKMPPEVIRKGRFDEIFFIDLPDQSVREMIFPSAPHAAQQDPRGVRLRVARAASRGIQRGRDRAGGDVGGVWRVRQEAALADGGRGGRGRSRGAAVAHDARAGG